MTVHVVHTIDPLNIGFVLAAIYIVGSFVVPFAEMLENKIRAGWESFKKWVAT